MTTANTAAKAAAKKTAAARTVRYVVRPGDTLSGIATRFGLAGGWQALYAASRAVIGSDPNLIHPGTVLTIPRAATAQTPARTQARPAPRRGHRPHGQPPPAAGRGHRPHRAPPSAGSGHAGAPARARAPVATGVPGWLSVTLLAVAILIGGTFLLRLVMAVVRRGRKPAEVYPGAAVRGPRSVTPPRTAPPLSWRIMTG